MSAPSEERPTGHDHPGNSMQIIPDLIPTALLTIPFLVTLVALHVIFFKPLFAYMEERDSVSSKARREAVDFAASAREKLGAVEARLLEARKRAGVVRGEARAKAREEEAVIIAAARSEAESVVATAVEGIVKDTQVASATLKSTASTLSAEIAQQVLGRSLAGQEQ
ncbi:MAG: F-type H+-transporting ATPase subunit b [Myxococcota bacterium]|jgi:F-type H+-transporting ATPase subunit b